jgi:predicted flap endonuclease-1-like 5' DNA nuclease
MAARRLHRSSLGAVPQVAASSATRERNAMPSIDAIVIGPTLATKLRKAGVRTTEALLKKGATRTGRKHLATTTGLTEHQILEWVCRADLMRVKGIGEEYADILEAAGVDTVKELKTRKAVLLHAKLVELNTQKQLVRRLPTAAMVEAWVASASKLAAIVKY